MSILIAGIDMPTRGNPITVSIYPDGTAEWEAQNKVGFAIPFPPRKDAEYIIVYCTDNGKREETCYRIVDEYKLGRIIKSLIKDCSVTDIIVARSIKYIDAYQERKNR